MDEDRVKSSPGDFFMIGDNDCVKFSGNDAPKFNVTAFLRDDFKSGSMEGLNYLFGRIQFRHTPV